MRPILVVGIILAALATTSCSATNDDLSQQYRSGSSANYISGDGAITVLAPESRSEPVVFGGLTDQGDTFDSAAYQGQVLVVNFWYAGCPPCRLEAEDLEALYQEFLDQGVVFIGVNIMDQAPTALAFADQFGVTYPSILDVSDGSTRLAFAGQVAPNAVPTTLVVDASGRVSGRISGLLTDPGVLASMISDVVAESAN